MKDKLLQFFTGKMSKSIYISIASAVVCGAVLITSTVIVHNNNQKIDAILGSLSTSENVTELSNESLTESASDTSEETALTTALSQQNGAPTSDRALQYLAEYDKLTAEYEAKRAELEKDFLIEPLQSPPEAELKEKYKAEWSSVVADNKQYVETQIKQLDEQYNKDVETLKTKYGIK